MMAHGKTGHEGMGGTEPATKPGKVKTKPKGLAKKSTPPLTKATKLVGKGASRTLKGVKKGGPGKGVTGKSPKSIEGKFF